MAKKVEEVDLKEVLKPMTRKLDELEARLSGLIALRETYDTRFTMLSEKIGEVRSMVLTQAKETADAKAKAERSLASIEGIKPEEFRSAIIKRDAEVETVKAKLTSTGDMVKALTNEVREFRNALAQFKGLETVIGMADDARKNIIRIQQLRDQIEVMSDKVMAAFLEFQRRFKEITDLSLKVNTLEETLRPLSKSVNEMDVLVKQAVTKADLSKLTGDIEALKAMSQEIRSYHESIHSKGEGIGKLRADLERTLKHFNTQNKRELAKLNAKVRVMEKAVSRILKLILSTK
jgi:chromosome segregation ATPase